MAEDTMIGRYLDARAKAAARNDVGLVRECDFQLAKIGYRPDVPVTAAVEARAEAEAHPAKRPYVRRQLPVE